MKKKVIIIGASGHGKVVADIVIQSGDTVIGFLDDNISLSKSIMSFPLLGTIDSFINYEEYYFVIAIGNAEIREKIANKMHRAKWYTAIHPSAVLSKLGVKIGEGTVVMANAVINAGTVIGRHCIINSGAIVEHDNHLEDFVHISVGAKLAGTVYVGKKTWIGIGANICNNLLICENCMIGAGSVIIECIESTGTYVGIPAKKIR